MIIEKKVYQLNPGDVLVSHSSFKGSSTVKAVQNCGAFSIIDFTDSTATAPVNPHAAVRVKI